MQTQLAGWRKKRLALEQEQQSLGRQIEALAPALLPKDVGAYSAVALEYELKGLGRFQPKKIAFGSNGASLYPGSVHEIRTAPKIRALVAVHLENTFFAALS